MYNEQQDNDYLDDFVDFDYEDDVDYSDYSDELSDEEYESFDDIDSDEYEDYDDYDYDDEESENDEDFDRLIEDIDFSNLAGKPFKKSLKTINNKLPKSRETRQLKVQKLNVRNKGISNSNQRNSVNLRNPKRGIKSLPNKKRLPIQNNNLNKTVSNKRIPVKNDRRPIVNKEKLNKFIQVRKKANINCDEKKISRILVPDDKKVIVEGVNKFILSQKPSDQSIKEIGYYKGKKLKELVLIFNNSSPNPFTIELFNPSAPLDYLYNTSQNLNNKIEVAGNQVSYSDVIYNLLANPALIPNCKFTFNGTLAAQQKSIPLKVIDREITGEEFIHPLNLDLTIDNLQVSSDIVFFDIAKMLNRPFIPDGMDTIEYTILPNMSVVMAFFYEQKSLKEAFYKEARQNKKNKK